jgi:hypothetical protein
MEDKFEVVVHHQGYFKVLKHDEYEGDEITWLCDPDYWSYFEIMGNLEVLGYKDVDSILYYDPYMAEEMVLLKEDDTYSRRVQSIAQSKGNAHIYAIHPVSQPEIIEVLEYNVWPIVVEEPNDVVGDNVGVGPTEAEVET